MDNRIKLSDTEYKELQKYISQKTGLYLSWDRKSAVENKLNKRASLNGIKNFQEYFMKIKYDLKGQELKEFVDLLTVNETYFFRNYPQFEIFQDIILPKLLNEKKKENNRSLKIWSAGCSIGCEPYTIAIILKENIKNVNDWDIQIIANDISLSALKVAKKGLYVKREVKDVPYYLVMKYFKKEGNYFKLSDEIIKMVELHEFNLLNTDQIRNLPYFDIIFCRNVLIYFDHLIQKKIVEIFYDKLNSPGYIFPGHSESLNRLSKAFVLKRIENQLVYMKE